MKITRRVWRYQRGNQKSYIEEEQKTQWPKEKVHKDKQQSTKHTYMYKTKVTRQWFLRRFLKFQPIRTHYWPWQQCLISDQHQNLKLCKLPPNEVWLQWHGQSGFWRKRFKFENLQMRMDEVITIVHMTLQVWWANKK